MGGRPESPAGRRWKRSLLEFGQLGFDGREIHGLAGIVVNFSVLDHPGAVHDEGGAFGDAGLAEIFLSEEAVIGDAVGVGHTVVVVAEQGKFDAFLGMGKNGAGSGAHYILVQVFGYIARKSLR